MLGYIIRRVALMLPTLFIILTINFFIIQISPGGPVEQMIARIQGTGDLAINERLSGSTQDFNSSSQSAFDEKVEYSANQAIDPKLIERIKVHFGFDKPISERYWDMMTSYIRFDFGTSFEQDKSVIEMIRERIPISLSLGLWTTLITYIVAIPLGIRRAVRAGTSFDAWSGFIVVAASAVPTFLFALVMLILFAGGSYWTIFPLRGLVSPNFAELGLIDKVLDYFWHMALPVLSMCIGSFVGMVQLTRNCFLDEMHKQYVMTARSKGLSEKAILYKHVFRNAMLIFIAGFPATFISMFFTGSLLIEVIFSLDGLGLMGFEAVMRRDYPIMFGTLYISALLGLIIKIISDIVYTLVDPRIDFTANS